MSNERVSMDRFKELLIEKKHLEFENGLLKVRLKNIRKALKEIVEIIDMYLDDLER